MGSELFVFSEQLVGYMLLISGLSVLTRSGRWVEFLRSIYLLKKKSLSIFTLAASSIYLPLGLALVIAHNVWAWDSSVIVTFFAWAILVKQVVFLFFPEVMKLFDILHGQTDSFLNWFFRIAGGIYVALSLVILCPYWF